MKRIPKICKEIGLPRVLSIILGPFMLLWLTLAPVEVRWAEADIRLLCGIMVILAMAVMLWFIPSKICEKAKGSWGWLDVLVAVGTLYYVMRVWLGTEYPCATAFLKTIEMVLLYFCLRCLMAHGKLSSKWIMGGLLVCGVYEAGLGLSQMLNGTSRHYLYLLTGTFQNPGPYSAFLMLGAVIGLAWMQEVEKNWQKHIIMGTTGLMFVLLPATWSRAAFISFGIVGLWMFRKSYWPWRWFVWAVCIVMSVLFYFIKQGSADGRILIWLSALTTWLHYPWTGVGIGGFLHASAIGVAELYARNPSNLLFSSGGVTDYAFNDLLKVLVEQGIIGMLLCIIMVGYMLFLLWQHSKPLFYGMLSLLIFSMFSYPFELLPYRIIFVMVAAWVASVHSQQSDSRVRYAWFVLSLLLILPSYLIIKQLQIRYNADRDYQMFAGMENEAFLKDYYELLPFEYDNPRFLFDFGKTLRTHGRYNDSNDMLRQGTLVSADPMFYVLMGNNYKDMGYSDLAEKSYKKAFSIMPNRIYPLYLLMQLYKETGNSKKAKEYAKKVVSFHEKIISPATKQMKEEAKSLIYTEFGTNEIQ